eukprot:1145625-Pelagomonas_calceolata.AAC.1
MHGGACTCTGADIVESSVHTGYPCLPECRWSHAQQWFQKLAGLMANVALQCAKEMLWVDAGEMRTPCMIESLPSRTHQCSVSVHVEEACNEGSMPQWLKVYLIPAFRQSRVYGFWMSSIQILGGVGIGACTVCKEQLLISGDVALHRLHPAYMQKASSEGRAQV